jgi:hypothetical protein
MLGRTVVDGDIHNGRRGHGRAGSWNVDVCAFESDSHQLRYRLMYTASSRAHASILNSI